MDQSGEYYIDDVTGRLYFWPPSDMAGARIVLSTLNAPLLVFQDATDICRWRKADTCIDLDNEAESQQKTRRRAVDDSPMVAGIVWVQPEILVVCLERSVFGPVGEGRESAVDLSEESDLGGHCQVGVVRFGGLTGRVGGAIMGF